MKNGSYYVINSDQEIRKVYYQMRQMSKFLKEKEKEGSLFLPEFPNLICDIFCSLYMINPRVKTIDEIGPQNFLNMTILKGLLINPSYDNIKEKTSFSKATALWATELFVEKLLRSLNKKKGKIKYYNKVDDELNKEVIKKPLEEKRTGFFLI